MTIKQLFHLNRHHVPARAMTVDMIVNLGLVFFVGNTLAILYTGNVGYILAHFFALAAFILLRRDRPIWPRPIKVSSICGRARGRERALHLRRCRLTYAAETKHVLIGLPVLGISVLLWLFRKIVQDGETPRLREETPATPEAANM